MHSVLKCLVYTFGISDDWSFENGMIDMGCNVIGFDPTISPHQRMKFKFHKVGLAASTKEDGSYMTFEDILKINNHTNQKLSLLKIDIEGWEMSALPQALETGALNNVHQLALEYHLNDKVQEKFMTLIQGMNKKLGFRQISYEANICWRNLQPSDKTMFLDISEVVWIKVQPSNQSEILISKTCGFL